MKDENEFSLPNFHPAAGQAVRRRFYVATVVGLALFFAGIVYWPLNATTFRTSSVITVQHNQDLSRLFAQTNVPATTVVDPTSAQHSQTHFLGYLRDAVNQTLSDEILADCIRSATLGQGNGIAGLQIPELRNSIDIRITDPAQKTNAPQQITITRVGNGDWFDQELVNKVAQDLASRLARKSDYSNIERQLRQRMDQVAADQQDWAQQLLPLIEQTRTLCVGYQNQLHQLGRQLESKPSGAELDNGQFQQQIEMVQQQVLTSDLQLLRSVRQQLMHHYNVDETDSMVQHLERLIGDRLLILSQVSPDDFQQMKSQGESVQTNPFMLAAFKRKPDTRQADTLNQLQQSVQAIRLDDTYQMLDRLKVRLENPLANQVPLLRLGEQIEKQLTYFSITGFTAASRGVPIDGMPTNRWLVGLSVFSAMIGLAFSLQWAPHRLSRQIETPAQLAQFLGLQHLGTVDSGRQKPLWLDRILLSMGAWIFRTSEAALLLVLGCVIVALVWDNQLLDILINDPLAGLCRAVWVLLGR